VKFEGHVHIHVFKGQHLVLEKKTYKNCRIQMDKHGVIQEEPWL